MTQAVEAPADNWVPEEEFGDRLKRLRRHLGLDVKEIAGLCGIAVSTWYTWEKNTTPGNMAEVVEKIHQGTRANRSWLMWGSTSGYNMTPLEVVEPGAGQMQLAFTEPPALASVV